MPEELVQPATRPEEVDLHGPISWWSWRPGIKPGKAIIAGGIITCMALALLALGIMGLIFALWDATSVPVQVQGTVIRHDINVLDRQQHLIIRIHTSNFPAEISPAVTPAAFHEFKDGTGVVLDYSPHLHILYALQKGNQRYLQQSSGTGSVVFGAIGLCSLGLLLLPYPLLILIWGWKDRASRHRLTILGNVIALRTATRTKVQRQGILPRVLQVWYGVALYSKNTQTPSGVLTFSLQESMYQQLQEGTQICITCSPCLHYVYTLETVHEPE